MSDARKCSFSVLTYWYIRVIGADAHDLSRGPGLPVAGERVLWRLDECTTTFLYVDFISSLCCLAMIR